MAETNPADNGKVDVAVGVIKGQVHWEFHRPVTFVAMDPENARTIAEATARAAFEARYGVKPPQGQTQLGDQLRVQLTARVALMLQTLVKNQTPYQRMAQEVVDACLREAT